ncbi:MAG TPA: hypothetical protein ENO16_07785, partial [Chromatiales bacterium]|nr:hypothetical protein [Chromatiales bacterium]
MTWILALLGLLFGLFSMGLPGGIFGALTGYLLGRVIALGDEVRAVRDQLAILRGHAPAEEAEPARPLQAIEPAAQETLAPSTEELMPPRPAEPPEVAPQAAASPWPEPSG